MPVVLVSAVAIGTVGVESAHDFAHPVLRLGGLPSVVIKVDHVLYGLITVGIVAHIHDLHLTDLVDDEAIVAVVEDGREGEDAVKLASESLIPAHEIDEPLHVMEDRPAVVE